VIHLATLVEERREEGRGEGIKGTEKKNPRISGIACNNPLPVTLSVRAREEGKKGKEGKRKGFHGGEKGTKRVPA